MSMFLLGTVVGFAFAAAAWFLARWCQDEECNHIYYPCGKSSQMCRLCGKVNHVNLTDFSRRSRRE